MTLPKWNDPELRAGTMIRTALWLTSEIGVGNSFTKEKHRQAFAGVAQADRRLRDLRDYGWVIHTSLEDVSLNANEQRFVAAGLPVWQPGVRKNTAKNTPTAKRRMAAFAENNYQCIVCGIAGGEKYPDAPQMTAVLSISKRSVSLPDGRTETMLISECKRCRSGAASGSVDIGVLLSRVRSLDGGDKAVFIRWTERGRRGALDRVWSDFRRLSAAAQEEVRKRLRAE